MRVPAIAWQRQRWRIDPLAIGAAVMVVAVTAGLVQWKQRIDADEIRRNHQLTRLAALTSSASKSASPAQKQRGPDELRVLNAQIHLLNRDWPQLLNAIAPSSRDIRLLSLDVDPGTAAIRITGQATTLAMANSYARSLEAANPLRKVRLVLLERRPGGVFFELTANWAVST